MARERKFTLEEVYRTVKPLLLTYGYDKFSFGHLAEDLDVSRGALYKYFKNKDELIMRYMVFELREQLAELKTIHAYNTFEDQFDFLLDWVLKREELHVLIQVGSQVPVRAGTSVEKYKHKLDRLHLQMYKELNPVMELGKEAGRLREDLDHRIALGFIFQTVAIPNHFDVQHEEWVKTIKDMIRYGLFVQS